MRHNDIIDRKTYFWPRFHIFHANFTRFPRYGTYTFFGKSCKTGVKYVKSWSEMVFSINKIIMPHVSVEKKIKNRKKKFFDFLGPRSQRPQPLGDPFFGVQEGNSKIASMAPFIYPWCTPSQKISSIAPTVWAVGGGGDAGGFRCSTCCNSSLSVHRCKAIKIQPVNIKELRVWVWLNIFLERMLLYRRSTGRLRHCSWYQLLTFITKWRRICLVS